MKPFNSLQTNELWIVGKLLSTNYLLTDNIYLIYMFKQDLVLNNLQGLICHKAQPIDPSMDLLIYTI